MGLVNCPACQSPVSTAAAACPKCGHPMAAPAPASPRVSAPLPSEGMSTIIPYTNPVALIAYYLGVFGLIPCLGIPLAFAAVVCGFKGLKAVRQFPERKGTGHAWAGIVLGSLSFLGQIALIVIFVLTKR